MLGNGPLAAASCLANVGESQDFTPPEALEFVEMLLDLARPAPGSRFFHEVQDEDPPEAKRAVKLKARTLLE
jgi:hypothetical protein